MNKRSKLKIEGKKITNLSEAKEVIFDFPIKQIIELDDAVLVRLEPDINKVCNENIFCVSLIPEVIWQVALVKKLDDNSPYTNMVIKNGRLFLYSWSGEQMEVNPKSGVIISKKFTK